MKYENMATAMKLQKKIAQLEDRLSLIRSKEAHIEVNTYHSELKPDEFALYPNSDDLGDNPDSQLAADFLKVLEKHYTTAIDDAKAEIEGLE